MDKCVSSLYILYTLKRISLSTHLFILRYYQLHIGSHEVQVNCTPTIKAYLELKCVLYLCSSTIIRLMSSSTFKHISKCLNHYLSISKWSKVSRLTIGFLTSCSVKFFFNLVCSAKSWYVVRGTDCKESKHILYSRECVTG